MLEMIGPRAFIHNTAMSDFLQTWTLVRGRFDDAVAGLNQAQLTWRMQSGALTLGEMALHVAGVETSFGFQLRGQTPDGLDARLAAAATDGVVNDRPFPFASDEITPDLVAACLARSRDLIAPLLADPDAYRSVQVRSALGPIVDGTGAFARLAYHPGYHQGQVHLVRTAPGFPA